MSGARVVSVSALVSASVRGSFKMALHKKHRVTIALGSNKKVHSAFIFFGNKCDLPQIKQDCDTMAGMMDECNL